MINWGNLTAVELDLIVAILRRYEEATGTTFPSDEWRNRLMDLQACHVSGCPLDLQAMTTMPLTDLGHDLGGISKHINRETGQLDDCFVPRAAKKVRYIVDGLEFPEEDSEYLGDGKYPPFVVFDMQEQRNVAFDFPTREDAQRKANELNAALPKETPA